MRAVVQRVKQAKVTVSGDTVGEIGAGLLVFLGISRSDTIKDVDWLVGKVVHLRIFDDSLGRLQHDVRDIGGKLLVVSQFTLYGDVRRGRRPDFTLAAPAMMAEPLYQRFINGCRLLLPVETGIFGADMDVSIVNWGPVTLWVETPGADKTVE
ncbi:MAG: D-aminoacyl-tRNA deacylase [Firmicutes bacterium]|nr:D-aminoacyl-tRNA deacylase [Bacillota bacterium]